MSNSKKLQNPIDIKNAKIPNICFSLPCSRKQHAEFKQQRIERGFDDSETWNLDLTIARFILPRLKRFIELTNGYPPDLTPEIWNEYLNKMKIAFESIVEDAVEMYLPNYDRSKIDEGLELFSRYFKNLWW